MSTTFQNPSLREKLEARSELLLELCQKWRIQELSVFGSVLGSDFKPESDIDVLVEFDPKAKWSLFDFMDVAEDLGRLLGRNVHLVEKDGLRNPFRRRAIMDSREVIYVA